LLWVETGQKRFSEFKRGKFSMPRLLFEGVFHKLVVPPRA
jgi:hypothetical protein